MGSSKRYKNKDCAYCGLPKCSSTNDHVIPRSFFLDDDRGADLIIPQVPACAPCNNKKSLLEAYVGSTLLIASEHPEGDRYRREKVGPRLKKNQKLWNDLKIEAPPKMVLVNGIFQPMHVVTVDNAKITSLLKMIVRGLYYFHFGKTLPPTTTADVSMIRSEHEAVMWAEIGKFFLPASQRIDRNLGRGSFMYSCARSTINENFTAWVLAFHGSIKLHGHDGSADHWWCFTRPTPEAVAAERNRRDVS